MNLNNKKLEINVILYREKNIIKYTTNKFETNRDILDI